MAEIRWTEQAADDLESAVEYIAHDSEHYASIFAINILTAIDSLEAFPESGRMMPECNTPQIRELLLGSYRIIYRYDKSVVELLTIYHGARIFDPKKLGL